MNMNFSETHEDNNISKKRSALKNFKERLSSILTKKRVIPGILNAEIPYEDKIKLLASFYTFNHGDKECEPFEYACMIGGEDDFLSFEQELLNFGYRIENVVPVPNTYKLSKDSEAFKSRIRFRQYLPKDIQYLILTNVIGETFYLRETPVTLEFLEHNGDERAKGTCNNFRDHVRKLAIKYPNPKI